ncbi:Lrp/AsnC family transcriptional regulator [Nonomuraea bangladeshensis]|uniref:Lrp/AsnC family transcriptional regulator n=1 Tax=Nonomuraea bangladeshensis TaxID=404385 RepID=UPI0031D1BCFD
MVLAGFDRAVVIALRRAPRAPLKALAAELGADERTVRRTMNRLRDEGTLTFSAAVMHENVHGWLDAQIELSCRPGTSDAVAGALAAREDTRFVAVTSGSADVVTDLVAPDTTALHKVVTEEFGALDGVTGVRTQIALRLLFTAVDWDPDGRRTELRRRAEEGLRAEVVSPLDETDLAIAEALRADVRAPLSSLARALGVHETTIQRRLTRMIEAGALHVRADVPPAALGYPAESRFTLGVRPADLAAVLRRLSAEPALRALYVVTGPSNVLGYSVHSSVTDLYSLLDGPLAEAPGLLAADVSLVLRAYKRTGVRT